MANRPSLTTLPTEIIEAIFIHLDPGSLISVSRTSKLLQKITTEPIIWRHYCLTRFKSWAPHHNMAAKFVAPLSDVDWYALFVRRTNVERDTLKLLDKLLESQQGRIKYINEIADFGYDVKETLLGQCVCPDDAQDVLARRYYANAILERIQREMAINVWKELSIGNDVPIEMALGAYDMFTYTGEDVDFNIITQDLDYLAQEFLKEYPSFHNWTTRRKASILANFFREQGFRGVGDTSYGALRNSFIGLVLRTPGHKSLPLISVAIYCALASRVGLDARPCGMLFHVYCLVYAPKDYNLDGEYKPTSSTELGFMYLDPFRSSDEVDKQDLLRTLREMAVPSSEHAGFLSHTDNREMTLRTGRNIMNSVQQIRQNEAGIYGVNDAWFNAHPDMDNSFYAALWAFLMLSPPEEEGGFDVGGLHSITTRRRQYLPYLLEHFQTHYPWDVPLLEQHVIPLFYNQPEGQRLLTFVRSMHTIDSTRKQPRHRTADTDKVAFKVGQLFEHGRYRYEGIITGWNSSCDAGEEWIQHMGVDRLSNGREQSFYHVL